MGYNVTKTVVDSNVAKISKETPKIKVETQGGNYELFEKAVALSKFFEGQFYEMGMGLKGPALARDAAIFGTGFLKFFIEGEGELARIAAEKTLPYELLVDAQEALKGKPKNLMQEVWVDRLVLLDMFGEDPGAKNAIENNNAGYDLAARGAMGYDSTADQLLVTEAWHLKAGPGAKDGRHAIVIEGYTLLDEPYEHEFFPFMQYSLSDPPVGFFGIGLVEDLEGPQTCLNQKMMRLDEALRLVGAAHVLVHQSSKVNFAQWDNGQGTKITYTGVKPEVYVPAEVVPQQLVNSIESDYHRCYELTGTPEAQAQGGVPSNLESGKAQEIYLDVTDQRQNVAIKRYHQAHVDAAHIVLALGREIVEKHNPKFGALAITPDGKQGLRRILLREVDLRQDEYRLKMWPANLLSEEPSARVGQAERLVNSGIVAPDEGKRLIDHPDLERANDLENASYYAVERLISIMLNEGRYRPPVPELNLQQAVRQVQLALIQAWSDDRPEDRLQLLRDWIADANALPGQFPAPQAPQMQASAGGTPVAAAPAAGVTPAMQGASPPAGPVGPPPPAQAA